jgi:hypothetical protein
VGSEPPGHARVDVGERLGHALVGAVAPHHLLALLKLLVGHVRSPCGWWRGDRTHAPARRHRERHPSFASLTPTPVDPRATEA